MTASARYVVDTHALYWHAINSPKLSTPALRLFNQAEAGSITLIIPHLVVAELVFLFQKVRLQHLLDPIITRLQSTGAYRLEPLIFEDVLRLQSFVEIPEMHHRLSAIQANRLDAPIITLDPSIHASPQVRCIW